MGRTTIAKLVPYCRLTCSIAIIKTVWSFQIFTENSSVIKLRSGIKFIVKHSHPTLPLRKLLKGQS